MALKVKDFRVRFYLTGTSEFNEPITEEKTVTVDEVLAKVFRVDGSKSDATVTVNFSAGEKLFSRKYDFTPDISDKAPNYIKQAYLFLKTLPEFEISEDC